MGFFTQRTKSEPLRRLLTFVCNFAHIFYPRSPFPSASFLFFRPSYPRSTRSSSFVLIMPRNQVSQMQTLKLPPKGLTHLVFHKAKSILLFQYHQYSLAALEKQIVHLSWTKSYIWKPKSYGTVSEATTIEVENAPVHQMKVLDRGSENKDVLSKLFSGKLVENFILDNSAYSLAQVRATFYPKFENEKSDQELLCIAETKPQEEVALSLWFEQKT